MRMSRVFVVSALLLTACGDSVAEGTLESESTAASSAPPVVEAASLGFPSAIEQGPFVGEPATLSRPLAILYNPARLSSCATTDAEGRPTWSVKGYWRLNGGAVQEFAASRVDEAATPSGPRRTVVGVTESLRLTQAGELEVWFKAEGPNCANAWDSKGGANYRLPIYGVSATAKFDRDIAREPVLDGVPKARSVLAIDFPQQRLPNCRATYNGMPTWGVYVEYRIDGGPIRSTPLTGFNLEERRKYDRRAFVELPSGARSLEYWILNSDRGSCRQYDSRMGANYKHAL